MGEVGVGPIPGFTSKKYQMLLKHLYINTNKMKYGDDPNVNMVGKEQKSKLWIVEKGAT